MPSAFSPYSASDVSPYGIRTLGVDLLEDKYKIIPHLVHNDHGMENQKKMHLLKILGSPEVVDHLLAGAAGVAIAKMVSSYTEMSKPAQTLLSLAGFGIGNILYSTLHENKLTTFDPHTGKSKIKL